MCGLGNTDRAALSEGDVDQRDKIRAVSPNAKDCTNRRCKWKGLVDEAIAAKNRTKSRIRARVEHSIGVIKRVLGFTKVRYRSLANNANRLFVTSAMANIFTARGALAGAVRPQLADWVSYGQRITNNRTKSMRFMRRCNF